MSEVPSDKITLTALTRKQRRVLGTLLEKAFTTPDQYPLTLKSTTTGCNQKNNREPSSSYDEDTVAQTLDELREMGLVAVLHTEGGRTERYRHYMRQRTVLTEPQLAILTELLLRGKQQVGELRTRASRMRPIESQEDLRRELQALQALGLVQANGPLDRRGIEVDHALYPAGENHEALSAYVEPPARDRDDEPAVPRSMPRLQTADLVDRRSTSDDAVERLVEEVATLKQAVSQLQDELNDLRRQLGAT